MHVHIISTFKKDWINSNREKVETSVFRRARAAYSAVSGPIWQKSELIQVFSACSQYLETPVFIYLYEGILDAQGQLTLFLVFQSGRNSKSSKMMHFLITRKFKNDRINSNREVETAFLAHLSRRLKGELIVYRSIRRPCVPSCVRAS